MGRRGHGQRGPGPAEAVHAVPGVLGPGGEQRAEHDEGAEVHDGHPVDLRHRQPGQHRREGAPLQPQQGSGQQVSVAQQHPALVEVGEAADGREDAEGDAEDGADEDRGEDDPEGRPAEGVLRRGAGEIEAGASHRGVDGDGEHDAQRAVQSYAPARGGQQLRGSEQHEQPAEHGVHDHRDQAVPVRGDPGRQRIGDVPGRDGVGQQPLARRRGAGAGVGPQFGHREGRVPEAHGRHAHPGGSAPGAARPRTHGVPLSLTGSVAAHSLFWTIAGYRR